MSARTLLLGYGMESVIRLNLAVYQANPLCVCLDRIHRDILDCFGEHPYVVWMDADEGLRHTSLGTLGGTQRVGDETRIMTLQLGFIKSFHPGHRHPIARHLWRILCG